MKTIKEFISKLLKSCNKHKKHQGYAYIYHQGSQCISIYSRNHPKHEVFAQKSHMAENHLNKKSIRFSQCNSQCRCYRVSKTILQSSMSINSTLNITKIRNSSRIPSPKPQYRKLQREIKKFIP